MSFRSDMIMNVLTAMKSNIRGFHVQRGQVIEPANFTRKQEWSGLGLFSILFMMWGLAYGLLDIMNYHVKVALGVSRTQAAALALSYYLAYWTVPFMGGPSVKRLGNRATAVLGLTFMALGDQIMAIGAQKLSLGIMCAGHFVVGLGVSMVERCANAYAVDAGPRSRAPLRILIGQSFAALGTVLAPPIARLAIFDTEASSRSPEQDINNPGRCLMPPPPSKSEAGDLSKVVIFYRWLGCGLFGLALCLAVVFFRWSLVVEPDIPASPKLKCATWKIWKHPLVGLENSRLWLGFVANFLNLGCQVTVAQFFIEHLRVNACLNDADAADMMMVAQILFLFGRLVAAALIEVPAIPCLRRFSILHRALKPRIVLSGTVSLAAVCTGMGIMTRDTAAIACISMVMFFEAPTFPMIFEAASAGLGEWTPSAESIIILSISGGGIIPPLNGLLADQFGISKAWILATSAFSCVFFYSLMCNVTPSYKEALDAAHQGGHGKESRGVEHAGVAETSLK